MRLGVTDYIDCAHLLAGLVADERVERIYALNRRGAQPLDERQAKALAARELPVPMDKVVLLEGSTAAPRLGLDAHTFEEIRASVTLIIHNGAQSPVQWNVLNL